MSALSGSKPFSPPHLRWRRKTAELAALIKPQFEVGKGKVGKGGVVRDPALHTAVCRRIEAWLADSAGWSVGGVVESPITGPSGNKEFLIVARRGAAAS